MVTRADWFLIEIATNGFVEGVLTHGVAANVIARVEAAQSELTGSIGDVESCNVQDAANKLGSGTADAATTCVNNKITEGVNLVKSLAALPPRGRALSEEAVSEFERCNAPGTSLIEKGICLQPVATSSALLVRDSLTYTAQATAYVYSFKSELARCATLAVGANAAAVSTGLLKCVASKVGA